MSIASSLGGIYDGLNSTLTSCNRTLAEKGGTSATTLSGLPAAIGSITSIPKDGLPPDMTTFIDCSSGSMTLDPDIKVPQAVENAGRISALESIELPHLAPAYVRTAAEALGEKVASRQGGDNFTFAFLADLHCGSASDPQNVSVTHAAQALETLTECCHTDAIVFGGDIASGLPTSTKSSTFKELGFARKLFNGVAPRVPQYWLNGNHDDAPYLATNERLSVSEINSRLGLHNLPGGAQPDFSFMNGNYGYVDFPAQRIRLIYLNTDDKRDFPSVNTSASGDASYMNAHNIALEQICWLMEVALDLSAKALPIRWGIVVCCHVGLDVQGTYTCSGGSYPNDTVKAATILEAYAKGQSGTLTVGKKEMPYEFNTGHYSNMNRGQILCIVHGHDHALTQSTLGSTNIPIIGCPNVMNGQEMTSADGKKYTKTPSTANDTAFTVITINRDLGAKIYADCYGAGYDRSFTL